MCSSYRKYILVLNLWINYICFIFVRFQPGLEVNRIFNNLINLIKLIKIYDIHFINHPAFSMI